MEILPLVLIFSLGVGLQVVTYLQIRKKHHELPSSTNLVGLAKDFEVLNQKVSSLRLIVSDSVDKLDRFSKRQARRDTLDAKEGKSNGDSFSPSDSDGGEISTQIGNRSARLALVRSKARGFGR